MIVSLQYGRALAAFMVLVYHVDLIVRSPKYWGETPFGEWLTQGKSGVFFFFALSGFIIAYTHRNDIGDPSRAWKYIKKRTARIYPMYWVVAGATAFGHLFMGGGTGSDHYGSTAAVGGIFTLIPFVGAQGNLAVAWTLFYEVAFYAFFLTTIVSRKFGMGILAAWLGISAFGAFTTSNTSFIATVFNPINLIFLFGMAAALLLSTAEKKNWGLPVAIKNWGLPVAIVATCLYFATWVAAVNGMTQGTFLAYGLSAAVAIWGFATHERNFPFRPNRLLCLLGDATFSIYLVHYLVISAITRVLILMSVPALAAAPFLVCAGMLAGVFAHLYVEKPLARLSRPRPPKKVAVA
ncbi:acyltransferase [Mesorhizobium sp. M0296]|uniref:acyltransferase family protein n=1 Tax=Mesorhizobium sp. M0296 TaxID=2956931 RepID=UPI0033367B63